MDNPKVKIRFTKKYGKAVFATQSVKKGEVIASFDGPIYDDNFTGWNKDLLTHTIQFAKTKWRDSNGVARYLNHSCEPNCGIRGLFKVVAMRDIAAGEQITWDYEMTEKSTWWRMRCKCGSLHCRKIIGNYANMPKATRKKYGTFISAWLRK